MSSKVLNPTTIVPPELYVDRSADRQLADIVDSMGRPGYVLVARQMGKTNLLLNMKRNLEREGGLPCYFDLSRRHETAEALFRMIVDTICELRLDLFSDVYQRIKEERVSGGSSSNFEFDRHLRLLLEIAPSKIVLILDEVDALVSTPYSDVVFAQIRSMYFLRATYPILSKLTYILSGVAEPADLIKDKNLSPFNIGEKIYLSDFSFDEVTSFIKKARLSLSSKVKESVFDWTAGNPRMLWDLCSELEDIERGGKTVEKVHVDQSIEKLYLRNFDRSPVDHIRDLVEYDPAVRDAVMEIKYGKGDTLDAAIRSKLYLTGIISLSAAAEKVTLKNKVIDAALSEKWIEELNRGRKTLLTSASEHHSAGRYEEAQRDFDEYLRDEKNRASLAAVNRFELAHSRYMVQNFAAAISDFEICLKSPLSPSAEANVCFYLGQCHLYLGEAQNSVRHFERSVELKDQKISALAWVSLAAANQHLQVPEEEFNSKSIYEKLYEDGVDSLPSLDNEQSLATILAAFYLAGHFRATRDDSKARKILGQILEFVQERFPLGLPRLYCELASSTQDGSEKAVLLRNAVQQIVANGIQPLEDTLVPTISLTVSRALEIVEKLGTLEHREELEALLKHLQVDKDAPLDRAKLIFDLWNTQPSKELKESSIGAIRNVHERYLADASPEVALGVSRALVLYLKGGDQEKYALSYLNRLEMISKKSEIADEDFEALFDLTSRAIRQKKVSTLRRVINAARKSFKMSGRKFDPLYFVTILFDLTSSSKNGDLENAFSAAREIIELAGRIDASDSDTLISVEILDNAKALAEATLRQASIAPFKNFRRNEHVYVQYGELPPTKKKFKKVRDDLYAGRCKIVPFPIS